MTTRREHTRQAMREVRILNDAWHTLYCIDKTEEEREFELDRDSRHGAIALKRFVFDVLEEGIAKLNEHIETNFPTMTPEEVYQFSTAGLSRLALLIGYRMFRIGQHTASTVSYDSMAQCPCEILFDEDIASLLAVPFDLEGEGWVIKNFDSKKEAQ